MVDSHCRSDQLDQARSSEPGLVELAWQVWAGWSTLLGNAPASYQKMLDKSKNSSSDREAKRSRSHREVIGYWLSRGRVDQETFFDECVEI